MATAANQYAVRKNGKAAMQTVRRKKIREIDHTFLTILIVMIIAGLVMLFSASAPTGSTKFGDSYHFIKKQLMYAVVGIAGMIVIARSDYRKYKSLSIPFMLVCLFALFLVITPLGSEHNGSQRWIFGIQPSEFMKFAMAAYCAYMIELGNFDVTKTKGLKPYIIVMAVTGALMMAETHLSGCIIILAIAAVILIVGGASIRLFTTVGILGGAAGLLAIRLFMANRWARIFMFWDPFVDTSEKGYQVCQGLYAIASGGIFGRGLGQSIQKSTYLPEPYNDFIFTIICEELGLVGAVAVIALFAVLIYCGLKIAFRAPDKFGMLTVIGIMAQIAIQTVFNIAVTTASIPCTGISLPFFSYGGTAIVVLLCEMGFVLSVSKYGVKPNVEKERIKPEVNRENKK